ncbi:MAG: transporter ATP-binding protein [Chloroflexi bacterium]|nr:transporter ATP-binding protein [Chloroflexota bacterium]
MNLLGHAAAEARVSGAADVAPDRLGAPAIAASALRLVIGGVRIVDGIDLSVASGEMLGVIGPNGAGKTTLFNLLSGLYRPTSGRVWLAGRDVTGLSVTQRARAGLGRTFQTSSVFPGLSVLENVRLAAQANRRGGLSVLRRPRPDDEATAFARARLADVGLLPRARTCAGQLAHGDKRKLEIALLLAGRPDVVLLDEPMAGVATADVPELAGLIERLHHEQRCTVLMVEHHLDVLLGLVDRVAVLHHGRLLACDRPDAVMADPAVQGAYLGEPV